MPLFTPLVLAEQWFPDRKMPPEIHEHVQFVYVRKTGLHVARVLREGAGRVVVLPADLAPGHEYRITTTLEPGQRDPLATYAEVQLHPGGWIVVERGRASVWPDGQFQACFRPAG